MTKEEKVQRMIAAAEQAIKYLRQDPPSLSLARGALKAALDPEAPRWGDE